ncbi:baseplate protein [Pseudomonas cichorii]|nr:baseplate protein [Pseudomonas cichorii]
MDKANAVTLTVGGMDYGGWKTISISAGIERQARSFTVGITWQWPGQNITLPVKQGDKCQVLIGGDLILTGWVFATPISYDDKTITLSISGRSLTADLVDCSAINKPSQWKDQGALSIIQALAAPYNVTVVSEIAEPGKVPIHNIEPAETAFKSIDRILTKFRIFSTDDEKGRLVLAMPGSQGRAVDRLELGQNILSASVPLDFSGTFSEYQVIGQRAGNDKAFGKQASEVSAQALDGRVNRKRVLVIHESSPVTPELAQSRANWERSNRMGKAQLTTYKVQGWRQSNGSLWRHNTLVRVVDRVIGFDQDMLISQITYTLDEKGTVTTLVVGPPEMFDAEPDDPHKTAKK